MLLIHLVKNKWKHLPKLALFLMHNYLRIFLLLLINLVFSSAYLQATELDSLQNLLNRHTEEDTTKVNLLNQLAQQYQSYTAEALAYAQRALKLSKIVEFRRGEATSLIQIADYYYSQADYKKTIESTGQTFDFNKYSKAIEQGTKVLCEEWWKQNVK